MHTSMLDMGFLSPLMMKAAFPMASTVAVIGNGPVGAESTERINHADVVVRFNNFDNRSGVDPTYRTKRCDVLVTHFDCMPARGGEVPRLVVHAIPAPFQLERNPRLAEEWYPNSQHVMVNPFMQKKLCTELGIISDGYKHPLPTVGFTWLWHTYAMSLGLDVYVCGFTWKYDQAFNQFDGVSPQSQKPLGAMSHHYLSEARWVKKALVRDARYSFDLAAENALRALTSA